MRWLIRMLIFWAISGPIFYFYGLPIALDKLSAKARGDAFAQCVSHLAKEGLMGSANSALNTDQGDTYCHCVSDDLAMTKADLMDVVQKKQPTAMTAQSKAKVEKCNVGLQQIMRARYNAPVDVAPPAPAADLTIIENN